MNDKLNDTLSISAVVVLGIGETYLILIPHYGRLAASGVVTTALVTACRAFVKLVKVSVLQGLVELCSAL